MGISLAEVNQTIATSFSSSYVNNFINGNRVQRVMVQLDAPYRMLPEDVGQVFVRNQSGKMVPLSAITDPRMDLWFAPIAAVQRCSRPSS